jgi:type II secretory pathway component PulK
MRKILKNRLALSTVITTLIILVVSVLLAGVVTYFAINVVSTRVQQESLQVEDAHIWVDAGGSAEGAILIVNTGGRDVVVGQITVRGQASTISSSGNVYFALLGSEKMTNTNLNAIAESSLGTTDPFKVTGTNYLAQPTGNDLVLASGGTMAVYITGPDSVTINDIGTTIGITVFTAQAMYYQETNVQATTTTLVSGGSS